MRPKALAAFAASLLAVAGATPAPALEAGRTRGISQSSLSEAARNHPQIVAEFGGEMTGPQADYIRSVGARVASQTNIAGGGGAFHVTILNSPVLNAFAVPGGYLYVTRQLVGLMNDEADLAFVLGHEAGHIAARHNAERKRASILSQLLTLGVSAVTGSSEIGQMLGQVSQGLVLGYSRNQEFEADDLGVSYIARAGYDPIASAEFLDSLGAATALEAQEGGGTDERAIPSWSRTHPLSADRVIRATQKARATGRVGTGDRNRDLFLARIDGMLVGDDPRQGVVEGRTFSHPDLRLRFTVPQGFAVQNGARSVSISGQQGQALFASGRLDGDLGAYLGSVFRALTGEQAALAGLQPRATGVNGMPAAYATGRVNTQQGQVDLTVFAYRWDSNTAYHFAMITPAGSGIGPFVPMLQSLTRLTAAQAAAIRPRVIDVVTVGPRDNVASLASRMAYDSRREERFRVMNGLAAGQNVIPGQKVKLVVYGDRG